MTNQINVGIQRQSYEPFETTDSEAENSGAETSLAGDSAGANTGGNPDIVHAHIDGESAHQAPPETIAANNTLNRYGIGDTVILGRPEYAFNNRAASVENTFAPNETAEMVSFAMPSESVSIDAEPARRATAMPTTTPTGFVPTSTPQPEPIQICPNQTDLPSSGLETTQPVDAKPIGKASTPVLNPHADIAEASGWKAVPLPPRDCAEYEIARAFGAAHGYSNIKIDKLTTLLYYANSETRFQYTPLEQPNWLSEQLDLTPVNADGTFDISMGWLLMGERHYSRASQDDSDAGNRNVPDGRADRGVDMMGVQQVGGHGGARAGAGQGDQDYANEMTAAAPGYGSGYDYDDRSNTYDSPDSTYDDPGSSPQIDLNPLPSLPPLDSNGPIMLPPPTVQVDPGLPPLPTIGVAESSQQPAGNTSLGSSSGNNFNGNVGTDEFNNAGIGDPPQLSAGNTNTAVNTNAGSGATVPSDDNAPTEEISLTPEEEARLPRTSIEIGPLQQVSGSSTPPNSERQLNFMGLNGHGEPLYSDPALQQVAPSEIVPSTNRFHGYANAVEGSIIGYDGNGTPYSGVPDTNTPSGMRWYSLDFADTNAFRASQAADLLGFAPLATGSTAASRLGAQLASQVLAAEMEFGPPQLRLAAAATLTGAALWAAGRQNTDYEALSPEERDRLRQPLINVPPPPLPPLPGLVPPPVPDNSILPGTSTQPNNLPPLGGFQISPPQTIDDLITESSRRLDANMRDAGEVKPTGYEAHHMIPEGDTRCAGLVGRMEELGFDIDGAQNGIYLPGPGASRDAPESYHRTLNNDAYFEEINNRFEFVTTREEALKVWADIRTELENGTFPGTRPRPLAK